jgi:K+/H+ antiporter YhaU regulatory subunit KhtT
MDVNVRERRVPGVGPQYELRLPDGTAVVVTIELATGERELTTLAPGADAPDHVLRLGEAAAVTLATLLSGVRFAFDSEPSDVPTGGVHVETVTIPAASPAVGRAVDELPLPDPVEATVLAVIRDDTPEVVEEDPGRLCEPGDRLVIAGRPEPLHRLREHLIG